MISLFITTYSANMLPQYSNFVFQGRKLKVDSKVTTDIRRKSNPTGGIYKRISQTTYQPKSVGEMADFETLTLCISLNSTQM